MHVSITYDPLLVLLSVAIAIQASYVGLRLTTRVSDSTGSRRPLLLIGASLSLAMGIWGMHFVGMLAAHLPVGVEYEVLPTLISFLLCVIVVGFAIVGASLWPKTMATLAGTAAVMGVGIATMHYIGMMALHDSLHMAHDPRFIVASVLAAVAASAASLWLATMAQRRPALIVCAILLGLAISSMHYIAMAGTSMQAMELSMPEMSPSLSSGLMAIVVAVVAFIISAGFFLTLVPEPRTSFDRPLTGQLAQGVASNLAERSPGDARANASLSPENAEPEAEPTEHSPRPIPVEREGTRSLMLPKDIFAVRANAHYCAVSNGREDLFCSLSISEVEAQLQGGPFARVHRSYIVNLDRILHVRKTADAGFADLEGSQRLSIPISRSKINAIRDHIAERHPLTQHRGA